MAWAAAWKIGCAAGHYDGGYAVVCNYYHATSRYWWWRGKSCDHCPNLQPLCSLYFENLCAVGEFWWKHNSLGSGFETRMPSDKLNVLEMLFWILSFSMEKYFRKILTANNSFSESFLTKFYQFLFPLFLFSDSADHIQISYLSLCLLAILYFYNYGC